MKYTKKVVEKILEKWNNCNLNYEEFCNKYKNELPIPNTASSVRCQLRRFRERGFKVRYLDKILKSVNQVSAPIPSKLQSYIDKYGLPNVLNTLNRYESTDGLTEDLQIRKLKAENKDLSSKYKDALVKIEQLDMRFNDYIEITSKVEPFQFKNQSISKKEVVPILQLSDWHVESVINPKTVNGINKCNPEIIQERVETLTRKAIGYTRVIRNSREIKKMIIILGGDMLSSYLREEDLETNAMAPLEAVLYAKQLILSLIYPILEESYIKEVVIACMYGNHPRLLGITGGRRKIKTGHVNNLEWLMYHTIKQELTPYDKVSVEIANSPLLYIPVNNNSIRIIHGDTVSYHGGVGGVTIPLLKKIMGYDKQKKANINFIHHFHQTLVPARNTVLNPCLCGFDAYAQSIAAAPEVPSQNYCILNNRNEISTVTRLTLDDLNKW